MSAGKRFYRTPPKSKLHHDISSQAGAEELACAIENYWREHGFPKIKVSTKQMGLIGEWLVPFYGIQSNIGPTGFPPR